MRTRLGGIVLSLCIGAGACGISGDDESPYNGYEPGVGPNGWTIYDERDDSSFPRSRSPGASCLVDPMQTPDCYWADVYGWCQGDECNDNVSSSLPVLDIATLDDRIFVVHRTEVMELGLGGTPGKPLVHDQSPNSERLDEIEVVGGRIFGLTTATGSFRTRLLVELDPVSFEATTISELGEEVFTNLRVSTEVGIALLDEGSGVVQVDLSTGDVTNPVTEGGRLLGFTADGLRLWSGSSAGITGLWDPVAETHTPLDFSTEEVAPRSPELTELGTIAIQNLGSGDTRRVWLKPDGTLTPLHEEFRDKAVGAGPSFVLGGRLHVFGTYQDEIFRRTALWRLEEKVSN